MRVLVVASHSAGHIWPAIAFCQGMKHKDRDTRIDFISTDGELERRLLTNKFNSVSFLKKEKITILTICNLIVLILRARSIINKQKPDLIVGFGGYLSISFIICAHFLKIPNFIHEQNFTMGLANRFLAKITDQVIFSFPNSQISDKLNSKALFFGFPIRKEMKLLDKQEARRRFDLDSNRFTLLVTGGSQGSVSINNQVLSFLKDADLKQIQVIHIAGLSDYERIEQEYRNLGIKNSVLGFVDNMSYAFSACDLAVCRAGAGTIAEIVALRIPSILIPYPYAKKHQLANASFLSDKNAAVLIEDKDTCKAALKEQIIDLMNNSDKLKQLSCALSEINLPDARERLVELAFNFIN
ncbi:undecaprenyldiphospho-muramoylpentapeptide beta-N-acetylglucosaminyltransferase [Candidatus Omnitrophota bacterium]